MYFLIVFTIPHCVYDTRRVRTCIYDFWTCYSDFIQQSAWGHWNITHNIPIRQIRLGSVERHRKLKIYLHIQCQSDMQCLHRHIILKFQSLVKNGQHFDLFCTAEFMILSTNLSLLTSGMWSILNPRTSISKRHCYC